MPLVGAVGNELSGGTTGKVRDHGQPKRAHARVSFPSRVLARPAAQIIAQGFLLKLGKIEVNTAAKVESPRCVLFRASLSRLHVACALVGPKQLVQHRNGAHFYLLV